MASLFKRHGSPFWWVKYKDHKGNIRRQSTGYPYGLATETRKAKEKRDRLALEEHALPKVFHPWHTWVPEYLQARHVNSPRSLQRKLITWRTLADYLEEKQIDSPEQLTREACLAFVSWRINKGAVHLKHKRPVKANTAIQELKILSNVIWEAVNRRWVNANPAQRLGLKKSSTREKGELSDDHIRIIRKEIAFRQKHAEETEHYGFPEKARFERDNADFLHISFEIALHQGCRMFETHLPLADISIETMEIRFVTKGDKVHVSPLNPNLVPLIQRLRAEGRALTYKLPRMASLQWWKFFARLRERYSLPDFKNVSFHSTRVTWASRFERAGGPEHIAMRVLGHASTTIHRIYRRVKWSEVSPFWNSVAYTPSAAGNPGAPPPNPGTAS